MALFEPTGFDGCACPQKGIHSVDFIRKLMANGAGDEWRRYVEDSRSRKTVSPRCESCRAGMVAGFPLNPVHFLIRPLIRSSIMIYNLSNILSFMKEAVLRSHAKCEFIMFVERGASVLLHSDSPESILEKLCRLC